MTNPFTDAADRQDRNRAFIPNRGERYRVGERISTSFVESTVHQVISKRFCKSSRCSGPNEGHSCCCKRGCKPSTRTSVRCSSGGIQTCSVRRSPRQPDAPGF